MFLPSSNPRPVMSSGYMKPAAPTMQRTPMTPPKQPMGMSNPRMGMQLQQARYLRRPMARGMY